MRCGQWRARRLLRVLAIPLLLAATAGLGPAAAAVSAPAAGCQAWTGAPLPGNQVGLGLESVAVLSACDAWLVGARTEEISNGAVGVTLIEHWNGAAWTVVPSPSPGTAENGLSSVSAVSADDVWAVGSSAGNDSPNQTLILHWDGTSWAQVPSPDPGSDFDALASVHAVSANDVWAVGSADNGTGSQTMILHWDGSSWTQAGGTGPGNLNSVTATAANDAWAVGTVNNGTTETTLIDHWDGTAWTQVPSPTPGGNAEITGVAATSAADAWAVGAFTSQQGVQTLTLHWNGTAWTQVPSPSPDGSGGPNSANRLVAVTATSAGDAWAVGYFTNNGDPLQRRTLVVHWNGTTWARVASPSPGVSDQLNAVTTGPAGDMWAIGTYGDFTTGAPFSGLVVHESPATGACGALAGAPPPSPGTANNELRGVAALSACDAWAVGFDLSTGGSEQTLTEHWDGSSWTVLPSPDVAGVNNFLTGVSATSPTDVWAVGFTETSSAVEQPLIEHWNGTAWTIVPGPSPTTRGSELNGVRALSATDVWAVGSLSTGTSTRTLVLHWDGSAWTKVASPSPGSSGDLAGVAATAGNDAWAVGHFFGAMIQPLALHWDGTRWARAPIPAAVAGSLSGVSAASTSNAWAVGRSSTGAGNQTLALRWNGHRWLQVPSPSPGVTSELFGVAAISPGNVWAVGVATTQTADQALILHWGGGTWSAVPGPGPDGSTLFASAATSASDAWAVGALAGTGPDQALGMHCC